MFTYMIFFISCANKKLNEKLPDESLYFKFRHVEEVLDSNDLGHVIDYKLLSDSVSSTERNTLIEILNEFGWKYKLSEDSEVLIWKISIQDLENLNYLDGELEKRAKGNTSR